MGRVCVGEGEGVGVVTRHAGSFNVREDRGKDHRLLVVLMEVSDNDGENLRFPCRFSNYLFQVTCNSEKFTNL